PQVGVLRRIAVINVDGEHSYVFINPEILESSGEQTGDEGCLSVPGKVGTVTRPEKVRVRALNVHMEPFELEAEGLLARACCHEFEHLDGIIYVSHVEGPLRDVMDEYEEEEDDGTEEES
ncbi:MAG: peptide deformylase, partial [Eubacterium sp.]|nr:peptide deformylase [Eubacterium sp.]